MTPVEPGFWDYVKAAFFARKRVKGLGGLMHDRKRYDEAEALLRRALASSRRVSGPRNLETLMAANDLAYLLIDVGRLDEAEPLLRETIAGANETLTPAHWFTGAFRRNLGRCLTRQKRYALK